MPKSHRVTFDSTIRGITTPLGEISVVACTTEYGQRGVVIQTCSTDKKLKTKMLLSRQALEGLAEILEHVRVLFRIEDYRSKDRANENGSKVRKAIKKILQ